MLYRSAQQDPTRRFHALYDKLTRSDVMWQAWVNVTATRFAGLGDVHPSQRLRAIALCLDLCGERVEEGPDPSVPPASTESIETPSMPGAPWPLGIPSLRDRVLMSAAKLVLEPIFEADFSPASFGFRPKRSAHDALEVIRQSANGGAHWVLDADIKSCFDEIDQDALMALIERRVCDRAMLKLLRSWLRAGIIEGSAYPDVSSGTPQGSPISPLLCNIALSVLGEELTRARRQTGKLIRFADDWVVLCPTKERADTARAIAETVLATLGLRLHPDKTRIVNLSGGAEGFEFLGFHNHMCESVKWPGRYYLQKWPSDRAMATIRAKVKEMTQRRFTGSSLDAVVDRLNPVLRGWLATSDMETHRRSSPSSTATSTNGWRSWPATSTDFPGATGPPGSTTGGSRASGSTG